ncbi:reverse transcriptase [Plakobranchus ocellatus]|uniref:Reverse transcriptase n=1 Tax=Plakobranchus ocellatus TaxID=259542 RepID=A0AAV4DDG8_9GAST|nr:reverse transcriptase [Plakobranchus ocellatus]
MFVQKLLGPFLVYESCTSTVVSIKVKINGSTRKWIGVSPGLADVAKYCSKAKLRLSLKSIVVEYKCGKCTLKTMLKDLEDPAVRFIQPQLRIGRTWKVDGAVNQTKEGLKMAAAIGLTQTGGK